MLKHKHIVCFSGGEGSALTAIEVQRHYGSEHLILLNHDITNRVESSDIKRFKGEIASHLNVSITYANKPGWETKDQFDVVIEAGAFKVRTGTALCTNRMKTVPFENWLAEQEPDKTCVIYYGFGHTEHKRIVRRSSYLGLLGYRTDYPLAFWPRTIQSTNEIGIAPPNVYEVFKHANCQGCLKAGLQHWYVVYCLRPDLWVKALMAEEVIGYSIHKQGFLDELAPRFERMKLEGIEATERIPSGRFWSEVRKALRSFDLDTSESDKPCECLL